VPLASWCSSYARGAAYGRWCKRDWLCERLYLPLARAFLHGGGDVKSSFCRDGCRAGRHLPASASVPCHGRPACRAACCVLRASDRMRHFAKPSSQTPHRDASSDFEEEAIGAGQGLLHAQRAIGVGAGERSQLLAIHVASTLVRHRSRAGALEHASALAAGGRDRKGASHASGNVAVRHMIEHLLRRHLGHACTGCTSTRTPPTSTSCIAPRWLDAPACAR
jgi:hypothetical protein